MLDSDTKRRIDSCRNMLVGRVPNPQSQVEQITIALIYKFMDDMDAEAEELGGKRSFFTGEFEQYGWSRLMAPGIGGFDMLSLYSEAIQKMNENPGVPALFRDIFKNAYLPYRDPETLRSFLKEINGFTYDHSERLGDAFEYLLSVLGSQGDAGQFRTPRHIIDFMVEIVDPKKNESILDPACGTAGFLISSYKHILKHNTTGYKEQSDREAYDEKGVPLEALTLDSPLRYKGDLLTPDDKKRLATNIRGYDISHDMVRLSLVNMYLHGFASPHIDEYDTLTSDEKWNELADVILANPPFMSPKGGIKPHKRFSVAATRSEVLFVDYIAEHLTPNGRAAVIVPEGIIFQSGNAYKQLREMLVKNYLAAVISLPAGVFNPYSGVKTSILVLDKRLAKKTDSILFAKIGNDGYNLGAQRRPIDQNDLPAAARNIKEWLESVRSGAIFDVANIANLSLETKEKIGENGEWNLNGERYYDSSFKHVDHEVVRIADVCNVNPRKSELEGMLPDTPVSFVPMQDLAENQMTFVAKEERKLGDILKGAYTYFRNGDILLAKVTPCFENGKAGVAAGLVNGIGLGSSEYYVLRPSDKVLPEIIYYFVTSPRFKEYARPKMTGTGGLQRVPKDVVAEFQIPLPPLEVQKEIVAEIEGYQKIIDGARQVVENYQPRISIHPDWPIVRLGDVCDIKTGKLNSNAAVEGGMYPFFTCSKEIFQIDKYAFDCEAILLSGNNASGDFDVKHYQGKFNAYQRTYIITIKADFLNKLTYGILEYVLNANLLGLKQKSIGGLTRYLTLGMITSINLPLPDIDIQHAIVTRIEAEQRLVNANKELIRIFENKIKAVINRVWGEGS